MTTAATESRGPGRVEFTALLAMSMALAAIGIDMMLPAFGAIRDSLGLPESSTAVSGIVTAYFLGLALGQLVYGPLADRFGRRSVLYGGYAIYGIGALAGVFAPTLPLILASRFVWGLGAAGPRVITLAVVRDRYEGEAMSRAMSFIMAVFILVPVVAPTLGSVVVAVASWRWLFGICVAAVVAMSVWAVRLPETLAPEHRLELRFGRLVRAARHVASNRRTVGYTLAMTSLYGVFTSYLGSAEIIFKQTFGQTDTFPFIFGGLAAFIGLAMVVNARVVDRVGTMRLAHGILIAYVVGALGLTVLTLATGGTPPLWMFLVGLALMLMSHGLLIPNFNTVAMGPMASVAGTASSVIGAVQIAVGALLGSLLDRAYDGTVRPLALGFLGYGIIALGIVLWSEHGRLFSPPPAAEVEAAPAHAAGG